MDNGFVNDGKIGNKSMKRIFRMLFVWLGALGEHNC